MQIRQTIRSGLAAALLAAAIPAAAPASATVDHEPRGALPVPTTATVTAAQLGADSVIAVVSRRFEKMGAAGLRRSLEVLTPDGVRHPVYEVAVAEDGDGFYPGDFALADWRPELHTALIRVSLGREGDELVSYDVTTGETRSVAAPQRASTVALDPDGSGVLLTTWPTGRRAGRVGTLGWDGSRTWLRAMNDGSPITSIDGRTLVTPQGRRWWVTDLTTARSRSFRAPAFCAPLQWDDADSVVAACHDRRGSQLRLVDLDGTSSPLGVKHTNRTREHGPQVFDDGAVSTVQGGSYYESYGGCGGAFLTRQYASGRVRVVRVPGWRDSTLQLLGVRDDRLLLARTRDDCDTTHPRGSLSLFDPVSREVTDLTVLGRRDAWREVFPATEVRAWIW